MSKENLNYNIDVYIIGPNDININDLNELKEKVDKVIILMILNIISYLN